MAKIAANMGAKLSGLFNPSIRTKAHFKGAFGDKKQMAMGPNEMYGPHMNPNSNLTMGARAGMVGRGTADYFWRQASGGQRAARIGGVLGVGVVADGINGGYGD